MRRRYDNGYYLIYFQNRLETAVTELYTRLKTKEQRVVELEAMAQFDKTGGKTNINADLLTKVGELTATLSTVEMERKNWQREMDALKAENEKLNEQVAQMTAQCKTYDDRIKTLETDLQSAGKEREVLRDQTLKMAKSEPGMIMIGSSSLFDSYRCCCWR